MAKQMVPVISIVGHGKSGKTTFLEKLIPVLTRRGIKVATVKHHQGDFEADREGKDSYRHKKAGASLSVIVSPHKLALVQDLERELTVAEIVERYAVSVDLVITEGYKREGWPKIEVYVTGQGRPPACEADPSLMAIVADKAVDAPVPVFLRDDAEPVADLILDFLQQWKVESNE